MVIIMILAACVWNGADAGRNADPGPIGGSVDPGTGGRVVLSVPGFFVAPHRRRAHSDARLRSRPA